MSIQLYETLVLRTQCQSLHSLIISKRQWGRRKGIQLGGRWIVVVYKRSPLRTDKIIVGFRSRVRDSDVRDAQSNGQERFSS